ncbi:helix-turn-helix domain-containing protein [Caloranaerobacter sp. DY30410]|uniref:helix-turn-helix domain-containing protein n=1 Tax=Caloranaerobacter sp. DY30410 TaxID=3238305 RepID=UPI003D0739CC
MDNNIDKRLFQSAKEGDEEALEQLLILFDPIIYKSSFIDNKFDEDCYQELRIKLIDCIKNFEFNGIKSIYTYLNIEE